MELYILIKKLKTEINCKTHILFANCLYQIIGTGTGWEERPPWLGKS